MTENFLYHLWQYRLFDANELVSQEGLQIKVHHPGIRNMDSGPDFFNARILIDGTEWAGNVEMHVCASDWRRHGHESDDAYDSCILHVVYYADAQIARMDGSLVPTLELKWKFPDQLWKNYQLLLEEKEWIPCHSQIEKVDPINIKAFIERVAIERLEYKTQLITDSLQLNKGDWEEAFYQHLARNFGFRVNAIPFEMLARSVSYSILRKYKNNSCSLDAILFGQSGLLPCASNEKYIQELRTGYDYFSKLHTLKQMSSVVWKFLRLRPTNFPTIRIAQFSNLIYRQEKLFSFVHGIQNVKDAIQYLSSSANGYWNDHYLFGKTSIGVEKTLGHVSIENILINTIVPFLFAWGKKNGSPIHCERALNLSEQLKAEDNEVIRRWTNYGIQIKSAFDSQALLHLKKYYCDERKCLNCSIGMKLIDRK